MPLGTEVGLGPGDIVLDGDPAFPTERGTAVPPLFGRCLLRWPSGRPSQQLLSSCSYWSTATLKIEIDSVRTDSMYCMRHFFAVCVCVYTSILGIAIQDHFPIPGFRD